MCMRRLIAYTVFSVTVASNLVFSLILRCKLFYFNVIGANVDIVLLPKVAAHEAMTSKYFV